MKLITFVSTAALALASATAAQAAEVTPDNAASFEQSLGAAGAGTYLADDKIVVNVTDKAAADEVEAAGGVAKVVEHSDVELGRVEQTIKVAASVPGMSYAVDPKENKVVVTLDAGVSDAERAHVEDVLASAGDAVRIEETDSTFAPLVSGGQAIYGGTSRCSLGFNVRTSAGFAFLTAGHCTNIASTWYANSAHTTVLGTRLGTSFPGNDYGIVRYTAGPTPPGDVALVGTARQDITNARMPVVGESVQRSGSTTGLRSGTVLALNATVTYPQGTVTGLIRTNVCAEPGDSGGPLFKGTSALGLTSGGSGNCTSGGITYYQPVTEALSVYGATIY